MELSEITSIAEETSRQRANELLQAGWILIRTYTSLCGNVGDEYVHYVLGWPKTEPPIYPKQKY